MGGPPPGRHHLGLLADLTDRGLACPLLVISDGNAGLIGAIEQVFPQALRQRWLIHRARFAVLDRASAGWRGLTMTADGLRQLQDLRRNLLDPPRQLRPRPATAAVTSAARLEPRRHHHAAAPAGHASKLR